MSEEEFKIDEAVDKAGASDIEEGIKKEGTVTIKEEELHLKTKLIPAIIMLTAGAATAIMAFVRHYPVLLMLELTLGALVVFLIVGEIVKMIFDGVVVIKRFAVVDDKSDDNEDELKDGDSRQEQSESVGEE